VGRLEGERKKPRESEEPGRGGSGKEKGSILNQKRREDTGVEIAGGGKSNYHAEMRPASDFPAKREKI